MAQQSGDRRFAFDSYRRFITMYSDVVLGIEHHHFEEILEEHKDTNAYSLDTDLTAEDWSELVARYKERVEEELGKPFPQDPQEQFWGAIGAVFGSWMNARANTYRRLHNIPESWGTAVNVQAMVFGNLGDDSATGVAFTRNPSTGEKKLYGEFLINAQGEDVVAGIRTPQEISEEARKEAGSDKPSLESAMPKAFAELQRIYGALEKHYRDMQDLEFTIEKGKLWMLQTRSGKRTAKAALRIAVELASEGLMTKEEAVAAHRSGLARSIAASDHRSEGRAQDRGQRTAGVAGRGVRRDRVHVGRRRKSQSPGQESDPGARRDEPGRHSRHACRRRHSHHARRHDLACGGGRARHGQALRVGRGLDPRRLREEDADRRGPMTLKQGDVITVDGSTGQVLAGRVPMIEPELSGEFATLMGWADKVRKLGVRANADTPADARTALKYGAEGIGLCRTEHMFFDEDRIRAVREMILADEEKARRAALAKILPMQRGDFVELFEIMKGLPVTIRLLDPPLHEFLPHGEEEIAEVAKAMGTDPQKLANRARELAEFNPMLGFRGCRIAIAYPEIAEMQARAIFEAAIEAGKRTGQPVVPEVMVPLIATRAEFDIVKARIDAMAQAVMKETGSKVEYQVGTMIELPRAVLMAKEIAEAAEFFSFGTNDLTQTTFGISRDDASSFLGFYTQRGILAGGSVRVDRSRGCRRTGPDGRRARTRGAAGSESRHLRRAWRRPGIGRLLPRGQARLCVLLAVPRADCAARRRAGRARQGSRQPGVERYTATLVRNCSTSPRRSATAASTAPDDCRTISADLRVSPAALAT